MSIFEFANLLFRVDCPIYVARQLMRHRNGVFLEKSLRHLEPPTEIDIKTDPQVLGAFHDAIERYKTLRDLGIKKEVARAVLPLATPTAFLWKINLRSLFNVFDQRLSKEAQPETRAVVLEMWKATEKIYPNLLRIWLEERPERRIFIEG